MGTTCTYKPKGEKVTDFFIRTGVMRWSDDAPHTYKVLDSALVNLREYYAALEIIDKTTGEREVIALVIKITMARSRYNFCYKGMDETMGPYYFRCPERILKLLTPTDNANAIAWRATCQSFIDEAKARPKIVPGMKLKYGGAIYEVKESLGQRGYSVKKLDESWTYRMKCTQAKRAEIVV